MFTPDEETIRYAKTIVDAFKEVDTVLVVLDGKLIEKPVIRHMERVLAISTKLSQNNT